MTEKSAETSNRHQNKSISRDPEEKLHFMILISQKEINLSVNQCTTVIAELICVQLHLHFYISIKSPIGRKFENLCEKGVKKSMKNTCWKAGTITYRHRYTPVCPCVRTQTHAKCSVTSACTDWHCTKKSKPMPAPLMCSLCDCRSSPEESLGHSSQCVCGEGCGAQQDARAPGQGPLWWGCTGGEHREALLEDSRPPPGKPPSCCPSGKAPTWGGAAMDALMSFLWLRDSSFKSGYFF